MLQCRVQFQYQGAICGFFHTLYVEVGENVQMILLNSFKCLVMDHAD